MAQGDFDCVEVHRVDGGKEWHWVVVGASRDIIDIKAAAKSQAAPSWEVFGDTELRPHVRRAMRWLKAIAYAGVIRNEKHTPVVVALLSALKARNTGNVSEIMDDLHGFDQPVVLGILVRLAISGHVHLDLQSCSFSGSTEWHWYSQFQNSSARHDSVGRRARRPPPRTSEGLMRSFQSSARESIVHSR